MVSRDVLMSIRPEYAAAIFSGEKTYELRRRRPSFAPGSRVVVYSSSPDRQLLGTFEAGEVHEQSLSQLWKVVSRSAGITRKDFDAYFAGCSVGYAIEVRHATRLDPKPLRFRPPQSYLFLRAGQRAHQSVLRWAAAT
jgi:predicted transcriptional regulator